MALLAGCSHLDNGLTKADYRDLQQRTPPSSAGDAGAKAEPPIPELQPLLAAPPPPDIDQRLVSVNVPDAQVPVRDVLIELARKVGVDLDLDQRISGGVIIYAKDRPFSEVIERICDMANLRYSFKNNVLKVQLDEMYIHDYRLDLPNVVRKSSMDVATSTDVFAAVQGGGGGGANNSSSKVGSESTNDPWKEIDENLKQILANSNPHAQPIDSNLVGAAAAQAMGNVAPTPTPTPTPSVPATTPKPGAGPGDATTPAPPGGAAQPGATQGTANPPAAATSPVNIQGGGSSNQATTDNSGAQGQTGTTPAAGSSNPLAQMQQQILAQATGSAPGTATGGPGIPAAGAAGAAAAGPAAAPAAIVPSAYFSVNKSAGIISVFGTAKQHRLVRDYLSKVTAEAGAQVLIEAKVVEVDLNDQFKSGIDWQKFITPGGVTAFAGSSTGTGAGFLADQSAFAKQTLDAATQNPFTLSFAGHSFNAALQFVEGFGSTRTLSSPRITALNNQTAVLKVAQNQVYFSLTATVTSTPSTTGGSASQTATYTSQLHTVPIGVVMTVQPEIDPEHEQVTLNLRPSVSVHSGDVSDPAVALSLAAACSGSTTGACSAANISTAVTNSNVPVVEVREMDSMVTVPSGDIIVMGGLMQSKTQKQETGVPGAADIPFLGNLFKVQSHETDVSELVIFLKATIVHGSDSIDWADKDLYKRYMQDPRPLAF